MSVCACVCVSPYNDCATRCATGCQCAAAPQLAAHSNCEFECLNCILFVANSLLQQLKANFAALHRPTPRPPPLLYCNDSWQRFGVSNQRGGRRHSQDVAASSKQQGALRTELLSRFFFISALRQKLLDIFLMWGAEIKAGGRQKNEGGGHALCDKTYPTACYESSFTITTPTLLEFSLHFYSAIW